MDETYGSLLAGFSTTTFEGNAMTLVLQALRSDQTLDAWGLGVWFGTFFAFLGLNFTTNDKLADLS